MSIAGTIPVLLCFLLFLIQRDSYNFLWGRKLLLTGVFFFLVPVQLVKYQFPVESLSGFVMGEESQLYFEKSVSFLRETPNEYVWIRHWTLAIVLLWAAVVFIFAVYEFIKYRKGIGTIISFIDYELDDVLGCTKLYIVPDGFCGPCVIGFFRQKIIIPESFVNHPDFYMVYDHEYAHMKNHDNLIKLLCLIILCFHWMNPVAYLLLFLYRITAEAVSDSNAVDGYSKEEIKEYAALLVVGSPTREVLPVVWKNNFSVQGKMLKRRINYMMKKRKSGLVQRSLAMGLSALTIMMSAGTVFAYEPVQSSDKSVNEIFSDFDSDDYINYDFETSSLVDDYDFSESDEIFVDVNGQRISILDSASTPNRAICRHSMVNGTLSKHSKNGSGGCTVTVYTCQRCNKCGYLANAKYDYTVTFTKCPH